MNVQDFIKRWGATEANERRHKDTFCLELCDVLGVPRPDLHGEEYVLEREAPWTDDEGKSRAGRMDLYKAECFVLEAKQAGWKRNQPKKEWVARASDPPPGAKKKKTKVPERGTVGWRYAMDQAFQQAVVYSTTVEPRPPFIIVPDLGYCFDVYACFDGTGAYRPYPDAQKFRFYLADMPANMGLLRAIWNEPYSLNRQPDAEKATREIGLILEEIAQHLEGQNYGATVVARFIMRCVFTMFACSVGLLDERLFVEALDNTWIPKPDKFVSGLSRLWRAMDLGEEFPIVGQLLKFNGGLFADRTVLPLDAAQLKLLSKAAKARWRDVEPAIFGALFQRALREGDEERRLSEGTHFTPRAYVERLLRPCVEEPLRERFDLARQRAHALVEANDAVGAGTVIDAFHSELCGTRVLDPACGTGNFLYVALDIMAKIEDEVLTLRHALEKKGFGTVSIFSESVNPRQFLGIERDARAKEIADLVLWIGYLQSHFRRYGAMRKPPQPVLQDYKNIEHRDAVLAWDGIQPAKDANGKALTRWDGFTKKKSALTEEEVPDSKAQVAVERFVNPRKAEWPATDFIVGNPPFLGNSRMRGDLGPGYTEALRATYETVPDSADFVMYWWERAAELVRTGAVRRAGLITMTSITQTLNRRVVSRHLDREKDPVSIVFAVTDHPWTSAKYDQKAKGGAEVRTAMTVLAPGKIAGVRAKVVREVQDKQGEIRVDLTYETGTINADLTIGTDVASARPLEANLWLSCPGVKLHGAGFIVSRAEATKLGLERTPGLDAHIRPYLNGQDVAAKSRDAMVIDLCGLAERDVRSRFPAVYQHVAERVKPERLQNNRAIYKDNWWVFGEPRKAFRPALEGLKRYIATIESARRRYFVFLDATVLPDNMLIAIAADDPFVLGVLSSRLHTAWALASGGRLGVRHDPRYNKTRCFEPFPFPIVDEAARAQIGALAEQLDAHRKRQQAAHPKLTLTKLYKALDMVARGEALTPADKVVWEQGLGTTLRSIHDDIDAAVLAAYGWSTDASDEDIVSKLVALNADRASEEAAGQVAWLRPEFQQKRARAQLSLSWPKELPAQVDAIRSEIATTDVKWTAEELAALFEGASTRAVVRALLKLEEAGEALRIEQADTTRWQRLAKTRYPTGEPEYRMVAEPSGARYSSTPQPPPKKRR